MMDMEFIGDYSVLLEDPEPVKISSEGGEPDAGPSTRERGNRKPWSLEYYQSFFNVNTNDVVNRVNATVGLTSEANDFQQNPDLYGPFWICVTLAIETGLSSYAAHYLQNYGLRSWRQTVRTVYQAGVLLFLYCWCLPTMLWIGLEWNQLTYKFRLPELWCVFGYATSILIPAAAFWAVPVIWLRWVVANLALVVSGVFICRYLTKAMSEIETSLNYAVQLLFFGVNHLVGCAFVVLFFPSAFRLLSDSNSSTVQKLISKELTTTRIEFYSLNITGNYTLSN